MKPLYKHDERIHNFSSAREIVPILINRIPVKSVLDVGCGTGTWLNVFKECGIADCLGLDGDYVDRSLLTIPENMFRPLNLKDPWSLGRKFDLVLSLEVAEHLPEESADQFVQSLVSHGDTIIFSAAIPGQGGQNHLNEQWPEYWQAKFSIHGFYFHDIIRQSIWNNQKIDWWYKQNLFLVSREIAAQKVLPFVHPACFEEKIALLEEMQKNILAGHLGIKPSFGIFLKSMQGFLEKNFKNLN